MLSLRLPKSNSHMKGNLRTGQTKRQATISGNFSDKRGSLDRILLLWFNAFLVRAELCGFGNAPFLFSTPFFRQDIS